MLDVACGPGSVARLAAARVGPSGRVVACDVSRAMLAIARAKPPLEQSAALEYIECSADSLGVPDDVFDVVSCQQGLQFFPNRPAALDEMRRSTRRAGRVGSAVWCAIEDCPIFSAVAMALGAVLGDETEAAYRSGPWGLPDGAELGDLVEGAGFVDVRVTRHRLPVVFEGGPEQLLETVATTPAAARVAELDAEQRRALERALGEAAAPMMRNGAVYSETASHIARVFVTLWEDGHHGDDFAHLWCAAPPGTQDELVGICEEAYRVVAPKRLVAVLDARRVSAERSRRAAPPPRAAVAFALSVSVLVLCPV